MGLDLDINNTNNILSQFNNANAKFYRSDGTLCANQEIVGTGYTIRLLNDRGEIYDTITIVIFGDINGDGHVDAQDSVLLSLFRNSKLTLNDYQKLACDVNHDNVLDLSDQWIIEDSAIYLYDIDQFI
ncbi:hypothetical protein SDC9_169706 [bioreactor metagenome]|uniref:Dockerin domain-containing protein n=1 Tax=bioreactor metagenome TaxID=1076179 RepID=A0A645GEV6_9ZZZZ